MYSRAINLHCVSHILALIGSNVTVRAKSPVPQLLDFMERIVQARNSLQFSTGWQDLFTKKLKRHSPTRWYSWYEVVCQVLEASLIDGGKTLEALFNSCVDATEGEAVRNLKLQWSTRAQRVLLWAQMVAVVHGLKEAKEATTLLEGDGFLTPLVYGQITKVKDGLESLLGRAGHGAPGAAGIGVDPSLFAQLGPLDRAEEAAVGPVLVSVLEQALDYVNKKFFADGPRADNFVENLALYKALAIFDPRNAAILDPDPRNAESANVIDLLAGCEMMRRFRDTVNAGKKLTVIAALSKEWKTYVMRARAADVRAIEATSGGLESFWKMARDALPEWTSLARLAMTLTPSSAMVERVFSWLKYAWGSRKGGALESTVRCSLFLQYNPKTREWTRTPPIRSRIGNIQPAVAQLSAEHLICYCRRGGGSRPA